MCLLLLCLITQRLLMAYSLREKEGGRKKALDYLHARREEGADPTRLALVKLAPRRCKHRKKRPAPADA